MYSIYGTTCMASLNTNPEKTVQADRTEWTGKVNSLLRVLHNPCS